MAKRWTYQDERTAQALGEAVYWAARYVVWREWTPDRSPGEWNFESLHVACGLPWLNCTCWVREDS